METPRPAVEPPAPRAPSGAVLALAGMADVRTARQLHRAAREVLDAAGDVTVDVTGVAHLDAAALQILIALRRALAEHGRGMCCIGVSDGVRTMVRHAGLEKAVLG